MGLLKIFETYGPGVMSDNLDLPFLPPDQKFEGSIKITRQTLGESVKVVETKGQNEINFTSYLNL